MSFLLPRGDKVVEEERGPVVKRAGRELEGQKYAQNDRDRAADKGISKSSFNESVGTEKYLKSLGYKARPYSVVDKPVSGSPRKSSKKKKSKSPATKKRSSGKASPKKSPGKAAPKAQKPKGKKRLAVTKGNITLLFQV